MNPVIPPALQDFLRHGPVTVRVKAKIDEKGEVTITNTQGSNPAFNDAVRAAVERWKFQPTIDENGPRCVETELPITMNPSAAAGR
jgi:TonB family protein